MSNDTTTINLANPQHAAATVRAYVRKMSVTVEEAEALLTALHTIDQALAPAPDPAPAADEPTTDD